MSNDGPRSGPAPSTGPEHDAWLREALRHAPDASASPPPSLREAILAEARAAARTGTATRTAASDSLLDRVLAFWSWLARPQVAAGFASVMAATLVGMLWWDRPMDETMLPPPPAVMAPRPVQEPSPATVEKQSPAADADRAAAPPADRLRESARSPAAESGRRDTASAPAKTAPPRAAEETTAATEKGRKQQAAPATADDRARPQAAAKSVDKTEGPKAERKDDSLDRAPPPSTTMAPATSAAASPRPGVLRPAAEAPSPFPARSPVEADAAPRQAAPAAPPPSPTAPDVQQPAPAQGRAEPFALSKKAESGEKESAAAKARSAAPAPELRAPAAGVLGGAALDSSEASASGRIAAQNAAESRSRQRIAPVASTERPMAPLLAALTGEETRWSRRLTSGDSIVVDAVLRAWLAQVQAAAARWQAVADRGARRDAPTSSTAPPAILRLERDGAAGAVVQIEDGGVLFDPLSGSAWFAPLPPDVVARLRATLPTPR